MWQPHLTPVSLHAWTSQNCLNCCSSLTKHKTHTTHTVDGSKNSSRSRFWDRPKLNLQSIQNSIGSETTIQQKLRNPGVHVVTTQKPPSTSTGATMDFPYPSGDRRPEAHVCSFPFPSTPTVPSDHRPGFGEPDVWLDDQWVEPTSVSNGDVLK